MYSEIIAAGFESHTKRLGLNESCGQNMEFFIFKAGDTYINR